MIIRHIPMKSVKRSSYSGLTKYITNEQGKQERVGDINITNCNSEDIDWAINEIQATQKLNTRATGDKTYHLFISFPAGESPSADILKDIEARVCSSIGYGEHQRVSAVHHDTDNLHIHISINKIHPSKHTLHEPYRAYSTFGDIAGKLEIEHGLQQTNHTAKKVGAENRAHDMEHHAGVESLLSWVKRECLESIRNSKSWGELHQVIQNNGLELRESGNGLIITDQQGIAVKASSVSRDISKGKLEVKLGKFEKPQPQNKRSPKNNIGHSKRPRVGKVGQQPPPRSRHRFHRLGNIDSIDIDNGPRYKKEPIRMKANTTELYAKYKAEQSNVSAIRTAQWAAARNKKNRAIEAAKRTGRLKRAAIKLLNGKGVNKKALYSLTSRTVKIDVEKAKAEYLKERKVIYEKCRRQAWADWLKSNATEGNKEALSALRSRESRQKLKGNTVTGKQADKNNSTPISDITPDNITKTGTIIYRVGDSAIRDDGDSLKVSRGASQDGLEAALHMAIKRYGENISVNGSDEFKEKIVQAAVKAKLNIKFDDTDLELRRQFVMSQQATKEQTHDSRTDSRTTNRSSIRTIATRGTRGASIRKRESGGRNARDIKPYTRSVGRTPPPEKTHNLRNLSELDMVQHTNRSEVLLPSYVSSNVEQQGTKSNDGMRWGVRRARGVIHKRRSIDDKSRDIRPQVARVGKAPPPNSQNKWRHLSQLNNLELDLKAIRPLVARVGTTPPPLSQNRLRSLSELRKVELAQGVKKIQPPVNKSPLADFIPQKVMPTLSPGQVAADKYVNEREAKRGKGFDIMKHYRYNDYKGGASFAGIRQIDSESLALLKCDDHVIVMPVEAATVRRLKRLSIGDEVIVTEKGVIKTKGRSR
ncbi:TraI/MobA(P) family conjugative relaxase [Yersinia massiliensis]|uniref:Conjugal transfer relaxase TraI n=1 Tax=Yersinia massiliensis TaxID=419257 RepID=A0ABM6V0Q2_9GAMM|nr:TraI/MobA(P) family conjugative relaxase [Yersinia massiliensis]AVX40759.1 conjugal transfer relaxase TraI [Yersinia massiliensis]